MQAQNRFAAEAALFEAMLPELMATSAHKWFVAWDGHLRAVVNSLEEACEILDQQPEDLDVMVREISTEEVRLPMYFADTK
jgi:hypothetical protein